MRVGIIGGGMAGLAAAYELTKQGHFAEVFEVAPFLGGQASTFEVHGGQLERGYHHLFISDTSITELIHELGLGDKLEWLQSSVGFYHGGKVWDFASPKDLLLFKPLPLLDRIRVGLWTFILQKTKSYQRFEGVTAAAWLTSHMGKKGYEVIWEPLLRGKFGEYHDQISMSWLWNKFALRTASRGKGLIGRFKEQLAYPIGSFGEVFDVLTERIQSQGGSVHINAAVRRTIVEGGRCVGLEVGVGGGEPGVRRFDMVLATVPSYVMPHVASDLPESYVAKLTDKTYLAAVLVILVLDCPLVKHPKT